MLRRKIKIPEFLSSKLKKKRGNVIEIPTNHPLYLKKLT